MSNPVSPGRVAAGLAELWSPRVVAELEDSYVKVAKVQGPLSWHSHDDEDELFYVLKGSLTIEMEERSVVLREGEVFVVPKGVRHNPIAADECHLMLIERKSTLHTGSEVTASTRSLAEQLRPVQPLPVSDDGVCLRRFSPDDLAGFQAYRRDEELARFQGWSVQGDREALEFILAMAEAPLFRPGHWTQLAIEDTTSGALVGDIGIFIDEDAGQAELGFTLGRPAQGKGLGALAVRLAVRLVFESTPVSEILGVTDTWNTASIRLRERDGMQRRSTQGATFKGEPCEEHTYVVARQDAAPGRRRASP